MAYIKNVWKDQNVEKPRTYDVVQNVDNSITLVDNFGQITELGTPVNALNMNHIEDGVAGVAIRLHNMIEIFALNEWVKDGDKLYKSLQDQNQGHATSEVDWWEEVNFATKEELDGEWTRPQNPNTPSGGISITSNISLTTSPQTFDLAEFLPKDNNKYEVSVSGNYKASGISLFVYGENSDMKLSTKKISSRGYPDNAQTAYEGTTIIGTDRKIYMRAYSGTISIASLIFDSYKRLGVR